MCKKVVLFVMPNLGGAGAERVISILLNNLDRSIFVPKLVIIKSNGANFFLDDLREDIQVISLGISQRLRYSFWVLLIRLIKIIKQESPNILFMGAGTINAFLSPFLFFLSPKIKKIARESNLPSYFEKIFVIKLFYRFFYNNYDNIIAQSDDMILDLTRKFGINKSKLSKINNPVDSLFIDTKLSEQSQIQLFKDKVNLVAAGRLNSQKGFDLLLKEFSKLNKNKFHLWILGEGEDMTMLKQMTESLDIEDGVTFTGNVRNPYSYMYQADLFILSSRYEGFPNVLLEAQICQCPILANNCPGGINEIISEGINGYIFSFEKDNFKEMLDLALTANFNKNRIREMAIVRYNAPNVLSQYSNLFLS